jgi:hypothetical protein
MYDRSDKDQPGLEVNAHQEGLYTFYPVTNHKLEHLDVHSDVSKTASDRRSWQNPFGLRPLWFALLVAFTTASIVGAAVGGAIGGTMAKSSSKDSSTYGRIPIPDFLFSLANYTNEATTAPKATRHSQNQLALQRQRLHQPHPHQARRMRHQQQHKGKIMHRLLLQPCNSCNTLAPSKTTSIRLMITHCLHRPLIGIVRLRSSGMTGGK